MKKNEVISSVTEHGQIRTYFPFAQSLHDSRMNNEEFSYETAFWVESVSFSGSPRDIPMLDLVSCSLLLSRTRVGRVARRYVFSSFHFGRISTPSPGRQSQRPAFNLFFFFFFFFPVQATSAITRGFSRARFNVSILSRGFLSLAKRNDEVRDRDITYNCSFIASQLVHACHYRLVIYYAYYTTGS